MKIFVNSLDIIANCRQAFDFQVHDLIFATKLNMIVK